MTINKFLAFFVALVFGTNAFGDAAVFDGDAVKLMKPKLKMENAAGTRSFNLDAASITGNQTWKLPPSVCASNQELFFSDSLGTLNCVSRYSYNVNGVVGGFVITGATNDLGFRVTSSGDDIFIAYRNIFLEGSALYKTYETDSGSTGANVTLSSPTEPTLMLINSGLSSIKGITQGEIGYFYEQDLTLVNRTGNPIVLLHEAAGEATPSNRINTGFNEDIVIKDKGSIRLHYSSVEERWMVVNSGSNQVRTGGTTGLTKYEGTALLSCNSVGSSQTSDPLNMVFTILIRSGTDCTVTLETGFFQSTPQCVMLNTGTTPGMITSALATTATNVIVSGENDAGAGANFVGHLYCWEYR